MSRVNRLQKRVDLQKDNTLSIRSIEIYMPIIVVDIVTDRGAQMDENMTDMEERSRFMWASKEGIVFVSIILVFILMLQRWMFATYWDDTAENSMLYFKIVIVVVSILLVLGILVAITEISSLIRTDLLGGLLVFGGTFIMMLGPAGRMFGMESRTFGESIAFVAPGLALVLLGMILLARYGGYFSAWLVGIGLFLILSIYEGMNLGLSAYYGKYTRSAVTVSLIIVVVSLVLFLYGELKFYFLIPMIKKGNELRREKRFDEALNTIDKVLRIYPNFSTAWNNKGNILVNMKRHDEALDCYDRALKINPDYSIARKNISMVRKKAGA